MFFNPIIIHFHNQFISRSCAVLRLRYFILRLSIVSIFPFQYIKNWNACVGSVSGLNKPNMRIVSIWDWVELVGKSLSNPSFLITFHLLVIVFTVFFSSMTTLFFLLNSFLASKWPIEQVKPGLAILDSCLNLGRLYSTPDSNPKPLFISY